MCFGFFGQRQCAQLAGIEYLEIKGYVVTLCEDGLADRNAMSTQVFDIVLLDVVMPKEDGFSFASDLVKMHQDLPFLFITARRLKEDVIKGLRIGAYDYIIKPFDAEQLVVRIENILKRNGKMLTADKPQCIGLFELDVKNLLLSGPGVKRSFTQREADLLLLLLKNQNHLLSREEILLRLWKSSDFFTGRSMDVFVSRLRNYLAADKNIVIENIRAKGIRFHINGKNEG